MKKMLAALIMLFGLVVFSITAFAETETSEKEVLRLNQEDIINHVQGSHVPFKMLKAAGTKEIWIEAEALNYMLTKKLDLIIYTPKVTMTVFPDSFKTTEWNQAVKTGEPVTAKLIFKKGSIGKVAENFDSWYYRQMGIYRYADVAYDISAEILVCGSKKYDLAGFAKPVILDITYPLESISNLATEDTLTIYVFNEGTGKWESAGGTVDKSTKVITAGISKTGLITLLSDKGTISGSNGQVSDFSSHWAKDDILFMVSKGIVRDLNEGKFYPNRAVTRGEFITYLVNTLKVPENIQNGNMFVDVSTDKPYYNAVITGVNAGLVSGTGEGQFAPDRTITREEIAVFLTRALKYAGLQGGSEQTAVKKFDDELKISSWARESVVQAVKAGLIGGRENNMFAPKSETTRAEAVVMLHRLFSKIN